MLIHQVFSGKRARTTFKQFTGTFNRSIRALCEDNGDTSPSWPYSALKWLLPSSKCDKRVPKGATITVSKQNEEKRQQAVISNWTAPVARYDGAGIPVGAQTFWPETHFCVVHLWLIRKLISGAECCCRLFLNWRAVVGESLKKKKNSE